MPAMGQLLPYQQLITATAAVWRHSEPSIRQKTGDLNERERPEAAIDAACHVPLSHPT